MENAKNKRKRSFAPTFDFISPYSLEECASRLSRQAGQLSYLPLTRRPNPHTRLVVELQPVDEDTYEFKAKWEDKSAFIRPYVTASGYLKRWEETSTHVIGDASFSAFYLSCLVVGMTALVVLVIAGISVLWSRGAGGLLGLGLIIWTVSIGLYLFGLIRLFNRLIVLVYDNLGRVPELRNGNSPKYKS